MIDFNNRFQNEMKYRVWNPINKSMIIDITFDFIRTACIYSRYPFPGVISQDVWDKLLWMEYSGVCDFRKREIYEGDIYKVSLAKEYKFQDFEYIGIVEFNTGDFVLKIVKIIKFAGYYPNVIPPEIGRTLRLYNEIFVRQHEYLGNVYENPELLEDNN